MGSLLALIGRRSIALAQFAGGISKMLYASTYWTFIAPLRHKKLRCYAWLTD